MTLIVEQSAAFEANVEFGITGLAGTLEVAVVDNDGATVTGPTTANISENSVGGTPSGNYTWNNPAAPGTIGQYQVLWSTDGTFDPDTVASEDLVIVTQSTDAVLPPIPAPVGGGPGTGPCSAWTSGDAIMDCCSIETTDSTIFDDYVAPASELLFQLSGRKFSGLCSRTVVACEDGCFCGYQVLSRGYVIGPWHYGAPFTYDCGCNSQVKLAGYPVREVTEVTIDGDVLSASSYRLDRQRFLVRLDGRWPSCEALCRLHTEEDNTITYTYGAEPPWSGQMAAAQLACEMYKACNRTAGVACALPTGVVREVRQGVTIDRLAFTSWSFTPARFARANRTPGWNTGMAYVDSFLNAQNSAGLQRRPVFYAPGKRQYAQGVG